MTTNDWEKRIKEICTYSADEGTSGYLLSEKQFQQVFSVLRQRDLSLIAELEDALRSCKNLIRIQNEPQSNQYSHLKAHTLSIISNLRERIQ